jgi:hypothetical protein
MLKSPQNKTTDALYQVVSLLPSTNKYLQLLFSSCLLAQNAFESVLFVQKPLYRGVIRWSL